MDTNQDTIPTRNCKLCGRDLPITAEFFHRHPKGKLGFTQTCKECAIARARLWWKENAESRREQRREYGRRTRFPGSRKDEYEKSRDQILEYHRRYYEENSNEVCKRQREYVAAHKKEVAERKRLAHIANREENNARARAYAAANPDKVKVNTAKRRARLRAAPGKLTAADVMAQYKTQRGTCFYCPQSLAHVNFHVDHYYPLSRGGSNEPSNIVLACPPCNKAKYNKLPSEFIPPPTVE